MTPITRAERERWKSNYVKGSNWARLVDALCAADELAKAVEHQMRINAQHDTHVCEDLHEALAAYREQVEG